MSTVLVTAASIAPVPIEMALRHCRALEADVDMVWFYLQAATEKIEDYLGRALVTKTYRKELQSWHDLPTQFAYPVQHGLPVVPSVVLPWSPLIAIDHVKYYSNGTLTTWSADNYRANTSSTPGRLMYVDNVSLPSVDSRHDAIQIQFQAGYGLSAYNIPTPLRAAVLFLTHYWFDQRTPVITGTIQAEMPMSLKSILRAWRVETASL